MLFLPLSRRAHGKACAVICAFGMAGLSASAHAQQIVSDTQTGQLVTTNGAIVVSGTNGNLEVVNTSAIHLNSTNATDNYLTITGGRITSGATSGTITVNDSFAAPAVINLGPGSRLLNSAGGQALNATLLSAGATFNASSSIVSGSVSLGGGDDHVTLNQSALFGNLNLGNADVSNTARISASNIFGNITGTSSTVDLVSGSVVRGNINLSDGENHLTINNSRVTGTISAGSAGTGDTITFTGVQPFTIMQAITGFDGATITSGSTVNVNTNFGIATQLDQNGQLNIAGGHNVTTAYTNFGAGSGLGIGIKDSIQVGQLAATGGIIGAPSVTINMGPQAGYITSGTQYLIMAGAGTATTLPTLVSSTHGLYSYVLSKANATDVSLTVLRATTASVASTSNGRTIGAVLDQVGSGATNDLRTVQDNLTASGSMAQAGQIVDSLAPVNQTAAAMVSVNVGAASANTISTRLASLRTPLPGGSMVAGNAGGRTSGHTTGISTGDETYEKHVWAQGFGNRTTQDAKDGNPGFTATTGGATVGADTDTLIDGLTTGVALTYGRSSIDNDGIGNATTDLDSYLLTLYGSSVLDNGLFVNGQLTGGYNSYDTSRQVVGFSGATTGSFSGSQYSAKLEAGRDILLTDNGLMFTPLAGMQYTYLMTSDYTERGPAALNISSEAFNAVDLSAGGQFSWNIATLGGHTLRPLLRSRYVYRAGDQSVQSRSRFVAGGPSFATTGVGLDRSSVNLGAGLQLLTLAGSEFTLDYDADVRSSLIGHTGQVKVRVPF